MKSMSNAQYSAIKRILATFAEIKIEGSPSVRVLNQQRIAKKIIEKVMKSTLNAKGIYVNCKQIEVKGTDCKAIIRVANCEDGYRAVCNYDYKTCGIHSPVTQDLEPHPTEREAIASAIECRLHDIIDYHGVTERKEIVALLWNILQEYNQLEFFEEL